ncbi:MAG TPA: hypothetical protein VGI87_04525 [Solirubrobacteraceae bacterium]
MILALISGATWFLWSLHDFGSQCGINGSGPTKTATVLLIVMPALIVAIFETVQTRSRGRAIVFGVIAALLTGAAVFLAAGIWLASYCHD